MDHAFEKYRALFDTLRTGVVAPLRAPLPDDPEAIAANIKAGIYFLDADMAGICETPPEAWHGELQHRFAVVILVAFTQEVGAAEPGGAWIRGTQQGRAELRAGEMAIITAGYIRHLGYDAVAHTATATDLDLKRVALQAGLAEIQGDTLVHPYLFRRRHSQASGFGLAAVSTDLPMTPDCPLARRTFWARWRAYGPHWWLGLGGTRPGWKLLAGRQRPMHLGPYPIEHIQRVDIPTTLITEAIPRVPQRANFFTRAAHGDLGPRYQADVKRFATKTPAAQAYRQLISAMVPYQDGAVAATRASGTNDPAANAAAIKAMAYYLGGDMVGICACPEFAWYSHRLGGEPIEPYHRNAIVILIDQGYETMEGASGDDWISGAQSMRAYMRGAEIAGIMAEHLRRLGWSARSQTNADSDVLHIPLVLLAGLGELSRIGELVLNPFVGPRFKSVVITTDLPLAADKPIDFGLQDFCAKCIKCARECPCGAISFGDKVMFNGYEMWKPDVEKCVKYRVGNPRGSACGRCMKTCPYNTEGLLSHRLFLWAAIKLPVLRAKLAEWDDTVGHGRINPIKKWWWDLEWVDGQTVHPTRGTNARELDLSRARRAATQELALYPAAVMPPPDAREPVPLNRKAGIVHAEQAEAPAAARLRSGRRNGSQVV
jgi:ferredoxin